MSATTTGEALRDDSAPRAVRWSPYRVATGIVLAAWAGLFWFLLAAGRSTFYLSTRTTWVVPVGAILLTVAAVGRLLTSREAEPTPIRRRSAWVFGLMLVPVLITLALPPTALSSFAADRRGDAAAAGYATSAEDIGSGDLTLLDVAGAQTSKEGQRALAARAGEHVSFLGFVMYQPGTPADELLLSRFVVSCCVADATLAQVRVVNVEPGRWKEDEWVRVEGTIYPLGREVIVDQTTTTAATRPNPPYLSP